MLQIEWKVEGCRRDQTYRWIARDPARDCPPNARARRTQHDWYFRTRDHSWQTASDHSTRCPTPPSSTSVPYRQNHDESPRGRGCATPTTRSETHEPTRSHASLFHLDEARWVGSRWDCDGADRVCRALLSKNHETSAPYRLHLFLSGRRSAFRVLETAVWRVCVTFEGCLSSASRFCRACSVGAEHGVE